MKAAQWQRTLSPAMLLELPSEYVAVIACGEKMTAKHIVKCPQCGATLDADPSWAGKRARCKKCRHEFELTTLSMMQCELDTSVASSVAETAHPTAGAMGKLADTNIGHFLRFELLELIGEGAFGRVYKARDTNLGRVVALKLPHCSPQESKKIARFLNEARSAAALRHRNIVPVYEAGEHEGRPFIVSEFIEGHTLTSKIENGGITFERAASWTRDLALALAYSHSNGIIHRDVKSENILLDAQESPYLTDFGLAKRVAENSTRTINGTVLGTPAYMSPEQARGDQTRVGPHSDQYSLAVVLYELLCGQRPFTGPSHLVIGQVIAVEPRPPSAIVKAVPRQLETICLKAMSKEIGHRYPSAASFAADLDCFLEGRLPFACRATSRFQSPPLGRTALFAAASLVALSIGAYSLSFYSTTFKTSRAPVLAREDDANHPRASTSTPPESQHALIPEGNAADIAADASTEAKPQGSLKEAEIRVEPVLEPPSPPSATAVPKDTVVAPETTTHEPSALSSLESIFQPSELYYVNSDSEIVTVQLRKGVPQSVTVEPPMHDVVSIQSVSSGLIVVSNAPSCSVWQITGAPSYKRKILFQLERPPSHFVMTNDGSRCAWVENTKNGRELFIADGVGNINKTVKTHTYDLSWFHDNNRLVRLVGDSGWRLAIETGDSTEYFSIPLHRTITVYPALSPDDSGIALAINGIDGTRQIGMFDIGRKAWRQITDSGKFNSLPAFSPDGRHLAYIETHEDQSNDLRVVCIKDGQDFLVVRGVPFRRPAWLPKNPGNGDTSIELPVRNNAMSIELQKDEAERTQQEEARQGYEQELRMHKERGDVQGQANSNWNLGELALQCERYEEARQRFEQALPMYNQLSDSQGQANCIRGLGDIALRYAQHKEARQRYEQALAFYEKAGDGRGQEICIQKLDEISSATDD